MTLPAVVPHPRRMQEQPGRCILGPDATVAAPPGRVARSVRALLGPATGYDLAAGGDEAELRFRVDTTLTTLGAEGYRLSVAPAGVDVTATGDAGLLNAIQTIRQLMAPDIYRPAVVRTDWQIPYVEIEDVPRFPWRGLHLDVSRHFMPIRFLHRLVDLIAVHKLNVFHIHLTDDQGWRLPSDAYPRLTEISSWRTGTAIGPQGRLGREPTPHGGSYTRAELADLVTHAADRNVTILPEIDLPGHTQAVLAAYPELGNGTGPYEVRTTWGISTQVLSLEDNALEFCRTVLGELLDIFPSPYIHVGGDEVPKQEWRNSARAQARRSELGVADEDGLQHWFTAQLGSYLAANGRQLVGWDEILEGGPPPEGATVMSWRGESGGIAAARAGRDVVMCPGAPLYFDYYQSDDPDEPLAIGGLNSLEQVCAYEPIPSELDGEAAARVLGSQAQLWSEYMPTPDAVEYMAFPRASALADVLWSPPTTDAAGRQARVKGHLERLDALGVGYRPIAGPHPWQRGGTGRRARVPNVG